MERDEELVRSMVNQPLAKMQAAEIRLAHLEAKIEQADYYIERALSNAGGREQLRGVLNVVHATLQEALESRATLQRVA